MLRNALRRATPVRRVAAVPRANMGQYINPKDTKKIWLSDVGAWPVIVVCGAAGGLCTWWNYRLMTSQPRIAWRKSTRGNLMKETEECATSYYNHSLRAMGKKKHAAMMTEAAPFAAKE
uniref:Uncharacterized protein n=2 Tax=Lotharella globosa TaxID=91324 RepID=A0A7S3YR89_9EUKA